MRGGTRIKKKENKTMASHFSYTIHPDDKRCKLKTVGNLLSPTTFVLHVETCKVQLIEHEVLFEEKDTTIVELFKLPSVL